jgi:hypothetical protein
MQVIVNKVLYGLRVNEEYFGGEKNPGFDDCTNALDTLY